MAKGTRAPQLDPIRLTGLSEGGDLAAHGVFEGLRFGVLDLQERDLTGARFSQCEFDDLHANNTMLRATEFSEIALTRLNAPVFIAPRSQWQDVTIDGSRLGSAELYESSLTSVRVGGSKLGYVNARGARLRDVLFVDCRIDELDLSGADLTRVAFVDTTIGSLSLTQATLSNVDLRGAEFGPVDSFAALRGATLTSFQAASLAASFAAHLGILIED